MGWVKRRQARKPGRGERTRGVAPNRPEVNGSHTNGKKERREKKEERRRNASLWISFFGLLFSIFFLPLCL